MNAANGQTLGYDVLNRINSAVSGTGGYGSLSWTYDKNGNVKTFKVGSSTTNYTYTSGTNRLATITGPHHPEDRQHQRQRQYHQHPPGQRRRKRHLQLRQRQPARLGHRLAHGRELRL